MNSNGKPKHLTGDAERREAAAAKPVPGKPEAAKPGLSTPAAPNKADASKPPMSSPDASKPAPSHPLASHPVASKSAAADTRTPARPETPPTPVAHPPAAPPVPRAIAPPEPAAAKPAAAPSPSAAPAVVIAAPPKPAVAAPPAPEPKPAAPEPKPAAAPAPTVAAAEDPWSSFAATQAAFARSFEEIAGEMTGMTRLGMAATADAALALLGARTFAEAVEINAGLAQRGLGVMIEGSARLSEIGAKAVTAASGSILSRFGGAWSGPFTR